MSKCSSSFLVVAAGPRDFIHFSFCFCLFLHLMIVHLLILMPAGMYDDRYSIFTVFLSLHSSHEREKLPAEKQLRNVSGESHREHIYVNTVINRFSQLVVTRIWDGKIQRCIRAECLKWVHVETRITLNLLITEIYSHLNFSSKRHLPSCQIKEKKKRKKQKGIKKWKKPETWLVSRKCFFNLES